MPEKGPEHMDAGAGLLEEAEAIVRDTASRNGIRLYHIFRNASAETALPVLKIVTRSEADVKRLPTLLAATLSLDEDNEQQGAADTFGFNVLQCYAALLPGGPKFWLLVCSLLSEVLMTHDGGTEEKSVQKKEMERIATYLRMAGEQLELMGKGADEDALGDDMPLTYPALRQLVAASALVREIDLQIAVAAGAAVNDQADIEGDIERLAFLGVTTVKQLNEALAQASRTRSLHLLPGG
jgi:hypothetical protein